ncbi:hypothetical protein [Nocardia terpenica]|nr:hypothetical protein [Nocardia terpenica]
MTKVVDEVSANRPVIAGIAWTAGGRAHAEGGAQSHRGAMP